MKLDTRLSSLVILISLILLAVLTVRVAVALNQSNEKPSVNSFDTRPAPMVGLESVQIGDRAPQFRLPSAAGTMFDLEGAVGEERLVLVFYRGHWCSVCARELAEMARAVHTRTPQVDIYAISTDTSSESRELAELIEASGYPTDSLHFLEDERHRVIEQYGVLNQAAGDTAHRAVFVLDREGVVVWRAVETEGKRDHESVVAELLEQLPARSQGS